MPLVSKSFSIDIVPGKTPPTIHVSEKDIGRLYYISIVDDGTPFSIPSGTTAKVEGTIGPYGFSENADVINNTVIVTLRSKMTAVKGKVWTKIKLTNNGDIASTCAFWLDVDKAGAVEGQYIDPGTIPDPGGDGGLSLEGFVQYNESQNLNDSEKAQARANIGAAAIGDSASVVPFRYLNGELRSFNKTTGANTANDIITNYLPLPINDHCAMFAYDNDGKIYWFDSFETSEPKSVVFKRDDGNTITYLTLSGNSTTVNETTEVIGTSDEPILLEPRYDLGGNLYVDVSAQTIRENPFNLKFTYGLVNGMTINSYAISSSPPFINIRFVDVDPSNNTATYVKWVFTIYDAQNIPSDPEDDVVTVTRTTITHDAGSSGAVLYSEEQNLTEEQKAQARANIGIEDEQDYEVIDFIESDGASYINTGILPTADLKVVVKVQHASVDSIASAARQYVLGTFSRDGENAVVGRYQFYYSGSDQSGDSFFGWGNGSGNVGFKYLPLTADTAEHTAIINNGNFRFDGTGYVTLENPTFTVQNPIYLFALNENGTPSYYSNGLRIESIEFSRNGVTVANFVPRMRTADGELGMLETVSNVFYTNNGTGHFRNDTAQSEYPYMVVVRPEQFGAKGDGVTDDTLAIQAALDAASSNGTVIFGKKKTYLVSRRDDDIKWSYATPRPRMFKYMLKISGSVTLLGQGATIAYKNPITQPEYDEEYTILYGDSKANPPIYSHPQDAKSAAMLYLDNSDKTQSTTAVDLNERHSVTIRSLILDGGMGSNGVDRSSASRNQGMTLGNWKAICAHGVYGMYLELDSVTIKDFAAEGVWGLWNPGSKIKAFGCTFSNCMPSAFNIHGAIAECIACTFNQDEIVNPDPPTSAVWDSNTTYQIGDRVHYPTLGDPVYECVMADNTTPPIGKVNNVESKGWITKWLQMFGGSEYAADLNIFDSCTFNINSGIEALYAGNAEDEANVPNHDLIARNCVFNRSNVKNGPSSRFWKSIINARYGLRVIVESCIFNDERINNAGQAAVSTHSFSAGQISNCVFNRPSILANDTYYAVWAKDSTSNIVNVSSFENGGSIHGRGLIIKLFNRKEYRFSKITQPKTITIIPATDDTVFEGYGFGDGNNFISVNKTVYAHLPIKINIDYMSIGRLVYSNSEDMIPDFRVVCSGHPTGTYNVWQSGRKYQNGNRVHYPTADDPVYECATTDNESPPAGEGSSGWYEVGAFNLIIET